MAASGGLSAGESCWVIDLVLIWTDELKRVLQEYVLAAVTWPPSGRLGDCFCEGAKRRKEALVTDPPSTKKLSMAYKDRGSLEQWVLSLKHTASIKVVSFAKMG